MSRIEHVRFNDRFILVKYKCKKRKISGHVRYFACFTLNCINWVKKKKSIFNPLFLGLKNVFLIIILGYGGVLCGG